MEHDTTTVRIDITRGDDHGTEPAEAAGATDEAATRPDDRQAAAPRECAAAAGRLEQHIGRGERITPELMRSVMEQATGGTDADGAWSWRDAYDAGEAATAGFIRRSSEALRKRFGTPERLLNVVLKLEALEMRQSVRSDRQVRLQQFSTPWSLAWCTGVAAAAPPGTLVLEPSAGTAVLLAGAVLAAEGAVRTYANEIDERRLALCVQAFPETQHSRLDAVHLGDMWPRGAERPATVVMNPPFSRELRHGGRALGTDWRHVCAALTVLAPGGRLVCITAGTNGPAHPRVRALLDAFSGTAAIRGSTRVDGRIYAPRGTTFESRLTIIDKLSDTDGALRTTGPVDGLAETPEELLAWTLQHRGRRLPPERSPWSTPVRHSPATRPQPNGAAGQPKPARPSRPTRRSARTLPPHEWGPVWKVNHERHASAAPPDGAGEAGTDRKPYKTWRPSAVIVAGAPPHPTELVESAAMAAVPHAFARYRPVLTERIRRDGMLSDAQLESIVLAGDATERFVGGWWWISESGHDACCVADPSEPPSTKNSRDSERDEAVKWRRHPVRVRQGWMLGDGTGAGKGRQVAGFILDQWLRGRRRAVWFSQSDKLIADAQRDWTAMGGRACDLIPLRGIKAADKVPVDRGILFVTYATLRQPERNGRRSRLDQICEWLAGGTGETAETACESVVVFDESHALSNAARREEEGARAQEASQQGRAGLALQRRLPNTRVLYVSATGASTLEALAYAERLGLWGFGDTPFHERDAFVAAMAAGGVAALEVVARDLKAMGRYQARALAYTGVEIEPLVHALSEEQVRIYNSYADAFQVIHHNLERALELTGITARGDDGEVKTKDKAAKSAALSTFESTKQRFFAHLLAGMKCPTLLKEMERDLRDGRRPVVQLVSTGEALMGRRLATIPANEWDDLEIDLTPREYVLEYLRHGFPTRKYEEVQVGDDPDDKMLQIVTDENGKEVESAEAVAKRERMILEIASLPGIPTALDQIVHHFGHERTAEITGRSRRILKIAEANGHHRLAVRPRPESATLTDGNEFQAGFRDLLVFSGAGNTGRSYHADRACGARQRRCHYLLEPGWRADQAIQGLGRTHRTNQVSAPIFRPVTTNVAGEKRFIATISRRLDSLGAITRGQRTAQTAFTEDSSQQLFRPEDNLESEYASAALRQLYIGISGNKVPDWPPERFVEKTGLKLRDADGRLLDRLPRIQTFLNRMVALRIEDQNTLFGELETRISATVDAAKEGGTYRTGMETLEAERIVVRSEQVAKRYPESDQTTRIVEIERRRKKRGDTATDMTTKHRWYRLDQRYSRLMINGQSGHAAHVTSAPARVRDDGSVIRYLRLTRAAGIETIPADNLPRTTWRDAESAEWSEAWEADRANTPQWIDDRWWLATGLLLPCWSRLPETTDMRVYRAVCEDGRTLIGRVLSANEASEFQVAMGLEASIEMTLEDIREHLRRDRRGIRLSGGWRLRLGSVHGALRVGLYGTKHSDRADLRAMGLTTEIVNWNTQWFVPDETALAKLVAAHPIIRNAPTAKPDQKAAAAR